MSGSPPRSGEARDLFRWELDGDWDVFRGAAETYADVLGDAGLARYRELAEPEWDLWYGDNGAVEGWEQICSRAPGPALSAWTALRSYPRARSQRQHPLKGDFATRSVGGRLLDQRQYEITGAGRSWYCVDDERRVVYLTLAKVGHPRQTD